MLKRAFAIAAVALTALLLSAPAAAQTTWTGAISSDWSQGQNWNPNGVPTASSTIILPGVTNPCWVKRGYTAYAGSIDVGPTILLVDGTLQAGSLQLNGGAADITGSAILNDLTIGGYIVETFVLAGDLTTGSIGNSCNCNWLQWARGTLTVTGDGGLALGVLGKPGTVALALDPLKTLSVTHTLTIPSNGTLILAGGPFSAGAVANSGTLTIQGGATPVSYTLASLGTNNGLIRVADGSLTTSDSPTNAAGKEISAVHATLTFPDSVGLTNNGTLRLAQTDVYGGVHNAAGSTVDLASGVVFHGSVSGAGAFTGFGTVTFEGGYQPGDSPAVVPFGGGVTFAPSNTLTMELGGTSPGTGHDKLAITGALNTGGTLNVVLYGGYDPAVGDTFDLFDFASETGTFSSVNLPSIPGRRWDTSNLYTTGTLRVGAPLTPTEASAEGAMMAQKQAGSDVLITYGAACNSTSYSLYRGTFPISGGLSWSASACGIAPGPSFTASIPEPNSYFVVVGSAPAIPADGSYGKDSAGAERPAMAGACNAQVLGGECP